MCELYGVFLNAERHLESSSLPLPLPPHFCSRRCHEGQSMLGVGLCVVDEKTNHLRPDSRYFHPLCIVFFYYYLLSHYYLFSRVSYFSSSVLCLVSERKELLSDKFVGRVSVFLKEKDIQ